MRGVNCEGGPQLKLLLSKCVCASGENRLCVAPTVPGLASGNQLEEEGMEVTS